MTEMVNAGNALSHALLQLLAPTLPGAHVGELTERTCPRVSQRADDAIRGFRLLQLLHGHAEQPCAISERDGTTQHHGRNSLVCVRTERGHVG